MRRYFLHLAVLLAVLVSLAPAAFAVKPDEMLADPALEARARDVGRELRCLVCQNQSIDDSDADLARDLRILLRQRIKAGDSDQQAKQFLVERYGDYVLLRPPFKATTLVLWLGPAVFLAVALGVLIAFFRARGAGRPPAPPPLDAFEQERLKALLGEEEKI